MNQGIISEDYKTESSVLPVKSQSGEEGLSLSDIIGIVCLVVLFIILVVVVKKQ